MNGQDPREVCPSKLQVLWRALSDSIRLNRTCLKS